MPTGSFFQKIPCALQKYLNTCVRQALVIYLDPKMHSPSLLMLLIQRDLGAKKTPVKEKLNKLLNRHLFGAPGRKQKDFG